MSQPKSKEKWFASFGKAMAVFGTLTSATAIISLIQHWAGIDLAAVPAAYLEYYRDILQALVGWIPLLFNWRFPQWYLDFLAINGVIGGAAAHAISASGHGQAKAFRIAVYGSIPLLAWLVGPFLVFYVHGSARSTVKEAERKIAEWDTKQAALRASNPKKDFSYIDEEKQDYREIADRYRPFFVIEKKFFVALILVVLATVAFFVLNGLVK